MKDEGRILEVDGQAARWKAENQKKTGMKVNSAHLYSCMAYVQDGK